MTIDMSQGFCGKPDVYVLGNCLDRKPLRSGVWSPLSKEEVSNFELLFSDTPPLRILNHNEFVSLLNRAIKGTLAFLSNTAPDPVEALKYYRIVVGAVERCAAPYEAEERLAEIITVGDNLAGAFRANGDNQSALAVLDLNNRIREASLRKLGWHDTSSDDFEMQNLS